MYFGNELQTRSDIKLSDRSKEYIGNYSSYVSEQKLNTIAEQQTDLKDKNILSADNETGEQPEESFFAPLNWALTKLSPVWNFFVIIYNIPTFLFVSLGVPLAPISHITNILTYVLIVALTLIAIKQVK
jgi:hypothetical protein